MMTHVVAPAALTRVTASPVLRIEPQSALRLAPDGRVPTGAALDELTRHSCPDCGFLWEACDCDLAPYRGAFDTEGRH